MKIFVAYVGGAVFGVGVAKAIEKSPIYMRKTMRKAREIKEDIVSWAQ